MENTEYFGRASVRNLVKRFENQSDDPPRTNLIKFKSKSSSNLARPRAPLLSLTDEITITENNIPRENASPTVTTFKERRALFEKSGATFSLRRTTSTNLECLKLQEINEISKKTDEIVFKVKKSQKVGSNVYISYLNEIVELLIQIGEIDTFGNAAVQQEKLATLQVLQKCYFQLKDKIQTFLEDGSNELEEVELLQITDLIKKWEQITEKRPSETYRPRDKPPPPPTTPKPVHLVTDIHYAEVYESPNQPTVEIKPVKVRESEEDDVNYKSPKVKELMNVFQSSNSEDRRSSSSKESSPSPSREIKNQPPLSPYKYVWYAELKKNESVKEGLKMQPALQLSSYVGLLNSLSPKIEDDEKPPAYEEAIEDSKIDENLRVKIQEIQDDIEAEMPHKTRIEIEEYEEKPEDNLRRKEEIISFIITTPEEQQDEKVLIDEADEDEEGSENLIVPNELLISYQKALENELISTPNAESGENVETRKTEKGPITEQEEIKELQDRSGIETKDASFREAIIASDKLIQAERAFYSAEEVITKSINLGELEVRVPISYFLVANDEPKKNISEDSFWTAGQSEKQDWTNQLPQEQEFTTNERILTVNREKSITVNNEPPDNKNNKSNLDEYSNLKDANSTIETHHQPLVENRFISVKNEKKLNEVEGSATDDFIYVRNKALVVEMTPEKGNKEVKGEELITSGEEPRNKAPEAALKECTEKEDNHKTIKDKEDVTISNRRTTDIDEETKDNNVGAETKVKSQTIPKDESQKPVDDNLDYEETEDPQIANEKQVKRYTEFGIIEPRDAKLESYEFIQAEKAFYSTEDTANKDTIEIGQLEVHVPISYLLVDVDEPNEDIPEDSTWTADVEKQDLTNKALVNLAYPENIVNQEELLVAVSNESKTQQLKEKDISNLDDFLLEESIDIKNEEKEDGEKCVIPGEWRRNNTETNIGNDSTEKDNKEGIQAIPINDFQESAGRNLQVEEISDLQNNNETETRMHTVTTNITVVSNRKGVGDSINASYDQLFDENGLNPPENSNINESVVKRVVTERVVLRKQESVKSLTEEQNNNIVLDNSNLDEYPSLYNNLKVTNSIIEAYDRLLEENDIKSIKQESIDEVKTRNEDGKDLKFGEIDLLKGDDETEVDDSRPSETVSKTVRNEEISKESFQKPIKEETAKDENKLPQEFSIEKEQESLQKPAKEEIAKGENKLPQELSIEKEQEENEAASTENLQENMERFNEPSRTKRGVTDSMIASYDLLLEENGLNQENVVIRNIQKETVVMRRHQRNAELIGIESFDPLNSNQEEDSSLYNNVSVTNSIIAAYDQLLEENNFKSIRNEETVKQTEDDEAAQKLFNIEMQTSEKNDGDPIRFRNKTSQEEPLLQSASK